MSKKFSVDEEKSLAAEPPSYFGTATDGPPRYSVNDTMNDAQWESLKKKLETYDTVILMDDSSSMGCKSKSGASDSPSRWEMAKDVLLGLSDKISELDKDGFDLFLLNNEEKQLRNINGPTKVEELRNMLDSVSLVPSTPLGTRLGEILQEYLYEPLKKEDQRIREQRKTDKARRVEEKQDRTVWEMLKGKGGKGKESDADKEKYKLNVKSVNVLIITDGEPVSSGVDEKQVLRNVLAKCAETVKARFGYDPSKPSPIGIQLVQIGEDEGATQFLNELDGDYKGGALADIVDTVPVGAYKELTPQVLFKVMIGGIDRKVDRTPVGKLFARLWGEEEASSQEEINVGSGWKEDKKQGL